MKRFLVAVIVLGAASASALTVPLPPAAEWMLVAPHAGKAAANARPFLTDAGKLAGSLHPTSLNAEAWREAGLSLLDEEKLREQGVDVTREWQFFAAGGGRWLTVHVADRKKLEDALDHWARNRLPVRDELTFGPKKKGRLALFSRSKGARAAMGFAVLGDRAVVMSRPGGGFDPATMWQALEKAPDIVTGADGPFVVWMKRSGPVSDLWTALRFENDGVALEGTARSVDDGWLARDGSNEAWIRAATAESKPDVPFRLRVAAGAESTSWARRWSEAAGQSAQATTGPIEVVVPKVDVTALRTKGIAVEDAFARAFAPLLDSRREGNAGAALLSCPSGVPVWALRTDTANISRALREIGLFSALRNDALLTGLGINMEFGGLLRAMKPFVALACQEKSGRIVFRASWRRA